MKNTVFSFIFICSIFIMMTTACERTDLQKSSINNNEKITPRIDDCGDCPPEDCCCGVQMLSSGSPTLRLCGTTSPDNTMFTCGPTFVGECEIGGFILILPLSGLGDKEGFCMAQNTAFSIVSTATVSVRITCQYDLTSPQHQDVILTANTPQYFSVNGDCEVNDCE
ncbi:MAG TPA: hypothetical protein VFG10_08725 [Saprospiraceae bacterium]|nr:hypothetical protein [Saprospiraceae bacterium]